MMVIIVENLLYLKIESSEAQHFKYSRSKADMKKMLVWSQARQSHKICTKDFVLELVFTGDTSLVSPVTINVYLQCIVVGEILNKHL